MAVGLPTQLYCNKALCDGRVLNMVLSVLQSNSITIEEFHHSLQDVTNFPLRPFVVPFLRAHLPLLQRELNNLARLAKQVSTALAFLTSENVSFIPLQRAEIPIAVSCMSYGSIT